MFPFISTARLLHDTVLSVRYYVYIIFHLVVCNDLFLNCPGHPTRIFRQLTARVLSGIFGLDFEPVPEERKKLRSEKLHVARSFTLKSLQIANTVNGSQNRGNRRNGGKGKAIPLQAWKALRVPRG